VEGGPGRGAERSEGERFAAVRTPGGRGLMGRRLRRRGDGDRSGVGEVMGAAAGKGPRPGFARQGGGRVGHLPRCGLRVPEADLLERQRPHGAVPCSVRREGRFADIGVLGVGAEGSDGRGGESLPDDDGGAGVVRRPAAAPTHDSSRVHATANVLQASSTIVVFHARVWSAHLYTCSNHTTGAARDCR
jgi:hypothetical protein